jgi:hypothetical protein
MKPREKKIDKPAAEFPSPKIELNKHYVWQIWTLRYKGGISAHHHLYSRISITQSPKKGWTSLVTELVHKFLNEQNKSTSIELLETSFQSTGNKILQIITSLRKGGNFSEAFEGEDEIRPPTELLNIELVKNKESKELAYIVRPEVMLPMEHLLIPWQSKSIPSPTNFSVFVSQLFYINKFEIVSQLDERNLTTTLYNLNGLLKKRTGFEIIRSSAPRLGNIEWYRLPFSNWNYEPYVLFSINKTVDLPGKELKVKILSVEDYNLLLVR